MNYLPFTWPGEELFHNKSLMELIWIFFETNVPLGLAEDIQVG